jgi:hypothetical protein
MLTQMALSLALLVTSAVETTTPPRLQGGFIQLQGWMMAMSADDWTQELDAMRAVGLETIVVQYLQYNERSFMPSDRDAVDPTQQILTFADEHGMRVFLGTLADDGWWRWDEGYLKTSLARRKQLIRTIHARYGHHRSFAGWYFTEEVSGNLSSARVLQLRDYFRAQSDDCKSMRNQPVAFAPFFSDLTPLESMRRIYDTLLDGSGIDVLMLQDGVGARGWDRDLEARTVPFFRMFHEVCERRKVALWADVESFQRKDPARESGFVPTSPARMIRQLKAVAPHVEKLVTFDFFHYMSPRRGDAQRKLYEGYRSYLHQQGADGAERGATPEPGRKAAGR